MWLPFSNKNEWKEHLNACKISGNQQKMLQRKLYVEIFSNMQF
jgi:hypothetical protein